MSLEKLPIPIPVFLAILSLISIAVIFFIDRFLMKKIRPGKSKAAYISQAIVIKVILLVLFFLVLETGLKIYTGNELFNITEQHIYDPVLLWRWKPGTELVEQSYDRERKGLWEVKINSRGIREDDFPLEKPPGTYRIAFSGDSWTFGFGVDKEDRFSDIVRKKLREIRPDLKIETINTGIIGYCTNQSINILEDTGFRYSPDLVISLTNRNEHLESLFHRRSNNPAMVFLRSLLSRSRLYMYFWQLQNPDLFARDTTRKNDDVHAYERDDLRDLVRTCREKNIKLMLVFMDWDALGNPQREVAEEKKVPYAEIVIPDRERNSFFLDHNHPDAGGHRIIADELVKAIDKYHFLPEKK
ncbi:MAG: hypothetical protein M1269_00345 [Chloroflexi bacterium]|nr:hypothetical protein [Chloroflexota bacterium]